MTNCETVRDSVQACLDGDLPPPGRAGFDAHVAACPACRRMVAQYRSLFAALDEPEVPAVPSGFARRVMSRVAAARERESAWQSRLLAAAVAVAAGAAILLTGGRLPLPGWPEVTDLSLAGALSSLWATMADLGEGAALQGGEWLAGLPTGPGLVAFVLAILAADLWLAYRWRGLARVNGAR